MTLPPDWRNSPLNNPLLPLLQSPKRKVFISYHHERDQFWFNHFSHQFSETYEVFQNQSLDEEVDSDDLEYVNRVVREDYIKGSSITIVLCGAETWKRRFIDWEIFSTLHHEHALLGIAVPGIPQDFDGKFVVPFRLHENVESGYAAFIPQWPASPGQLKNQIETALNRAALRWLIKNETPRMKRNRA